MTHWGVTGAACLVSVYPCQCDQFTTVIFSVYKHVQETTLAGETSVLTAQSQRPDHRHQRWCWWRRALADPDKYAGSRQQMTQLHLGVLSSLGVSAHRTRAETRVRRCATNAGRSGQVGAPVLFAVSCFLMMRCIAVVSLSGILQSAARRALGDSRVANQILGRRGAVGSGAPQLRWESARAASTLWGSAPRWPTPPGIFRWPRRTLQRLLVLQEAALVDQTELRHLGRWGAWHATQQRPGAQARGDERGLGR